MLQSAQMRSEAERSQAVPAERLGHILPKTEPDAPKPSCSDTLMTVWGWIFDIGTIVISLVDVVSDVMVAVQFYEAGQTTFFGLVMASLVLSNIIYCVFACEVMLQRASSSLPPWLDCFTRLPRPLKYVIMMPIAQLTPTLHWAKEQAGWTSNLFGHIKTADWRAPTVIPAALKEEADAMSRSAQVMGRLEGALKEHLNTHILFYVETVVESIPQSIIQLLAVTFLGQATGLQVFSMSLSLFSIVSKAYVISYSYSVKVFVFKFLLAAHDVFSLFYVFATLLGKEEPHEKLFAGKVWLSYLSYAWLIKVFVICSYILVCLICLGVTIVFHECRSRRIRRGDVGLAFFLCGGVTILSIPVAIALEGTKLIWFIGLIAQNEPQQKNKFPIAARILSFVDRGNYNERLRFLWRRYLDERNLPIARSRPSEFAHQTFNQYTFEQRRGCAYEEPAVIPRYWMVVENEPFVPNDLHWVGVRGGGTRKFRWRAPSCNRCEQIGQVAALIGAVLYALGQIFSFLFPFISFGIRYQTQNLLQRFCFFSMIGPLCAALCLAPYAYKYYWFNTHVKHLLALGTNETLQNTLNRWIASYHVPPYALIVRRAVPNDLIPFDVVDHLSRFLRPNDVDMSQLSIAECRALKEQFLGTVGAAAETFQQGESSYTAVVPPAAITQRKRAGSKTDSAGFRVTTPRPRRGGSGGMDIELERQPSADDGTASVTIETRSEQPEPLLSRQQSTVAEDMQRELSSYDFERTESAHITPYTAGMSREPTGEDEIVRDIGRLW